MSASWIPAQAGIQARADGAEAEGRPEETYRWGCEEHLSSPRKRGSSKSTVVRSSPVCRDNQPIRDCARGVRRWIPAYAGMTKEDRTARQDTARTIRPALWK